MPNPRHEVYRVPHKGYYRIEAKLPDGRVLVGEEAVGAELDRLYDLTNSQDVALDVAARLLGNDRWREAVIIPMADMILQERENVRRDVDQLNVRMFHLTNERDRLREELEKHGRTDPGDPDGGAAGTDDRDTRDAIGHASTC